MSNATVRVAPKGMRFLKVIIKCLLMLIITLVLFEIVSNTVGYALFRTVFSGQEYDFAFPLSLVISFGISLASVIAVYMWWQRRHGSGK
jgi:ABC-type maltose transport system permease subunit